MNISTYLPDIVPTLIIFVTTLAIQGLMQSKPNKMRKNGQDGLKGLSLKNRMKRILEDDRAFEVRKDYRMAIPRTYNQEPKFLTTNFN